MSDEDIGEEGWGDIGDEGSADAAAVWADAAAGSPDADAGWADAGSYGADDDDADAGWADAGSDDADQITSQGGVESEKPLVVGDYYIFSLDAKLSRERVEPFLAKLTDIQPADLTAHFEDEDNKIVVFSYSDESEGADENYQLLWETPNYKVLDMSLVTLYDMEGDESPYEEPAEYEIATVVRDKRVYSEEVQKDDLLSHLIRVLDIYDKPLMIREATQSVSVFTEMLRYPSTPLIDSLYSWGGNLFPPYLVPIVSDELKLYDTEHTVHQEVQNELLARESGFQTYQEALVSEAVHTNPFLVAEGLGYTTNDYAGTYLRDCLQSATCTGIAGNYTYDERRNTSGITIPEFKKDEMNQDYTAFTQVIPSLEMRVSGFLEEPFQEIMYSLDESLTRGLTLKDRIRLHGLYDVSQIHKRDRVSQIMIVNHSDGPDTFREPPNDNYINHTFMDTLSIEAFGATMEANVARPSDIATYLETADLSQVLVNYREFEDAFFKYRLSMGQLTKDVREDIQALIELNVREYISQNKTRVKTKYKANAAVAHPPLSLGQKTLISKSYIFHMINERSRNALLKEFIRVYTRDSDKAHESVHYLYSKYSSDKLLCKHYSYVVEMTNDNQVFDTMRTVYGSTPEDGQIHCKVCGEYLCDEDASLVEGFSDDKPVSSREVLETETTDDMARATYLEKNRANVGYVSDIAGSLGLDAEEEFIYDVLKSAESSDPNELSDIRYGLVNVVNSDIHPRVTMKIKDLKDKEHKTKDKAEKKDLKRQRENVISEFQKWLRDTNKLLMYVSLIVLFIQTAVPSLNVRKTSEFRLIDLRSEAKKGVFRTETLAYLEAKIKRLCNSYQREQFWSHCSDLFNESKYNSNDLKSQIKNTVLYSLSPNFPELQKRLKVYQVFTEFEKKVYLRPEWTLFKPQSRNTLNLSIHDYLEDLNNDINLKRRFRGYLIENISLVRPLVESGNESLATLCKVPTLEIVQNKAFQKLFRYTVSCYGIHPNHVSVTILIYQMIEDASKSDSIKGVLKQNGWSETSGGFKNLNFRVWRESIIPNILSLYGAEGSSNIKSCYSNEGSCNSFIHRLVNNYDLPVLNTLPKRIYSSFHPRCFPICHSHG